MGDLSAKDDDEFEFSVGSSSRYSPRHILERNRDSHRCPSRLDVECPPGLFCRREENLKRQAETGNMTCNDMEKSLSPDRYARRATPGHGRCRALLDPTPRAPNITAAPVSHVGSALNSSDHRFQGMQTRPIRIRLHPFGSLRLNSLRLNFSLKYSPMGIN